MVPAIFSGHFWRIPLWKKQPDMTDKIVTSIARQIRRTPFAAIGTCAYILGFAVPFEWDLPLIALAVFAILSIVFNPGNTPTSRPALLFPVMFFVVSVGASTFVSINATWSLFLSASLLPAGLIYFLVAGQFYSFRHVRMLVSARVFKVRKDRGTPVRARPRRHRAGAFPSNGRAAAAVRVR